MTPQMRLRLQWVAVHSFALACTLFFVLPFVFVALTAVMTDEQSLTRDLWPNSFEWHNLIDVWHTPGFGTWWRNTLIYAVGGTVLTLVSSIPVAYALAHFRFRGRQLAMMMVIATMMLPPQVVIIPMYLVWAKQLHLTGTLWPLVVPLAFGDAYSIFLLRQFLVTVPREYLDAAKVDGANGVGGDGTTVRFAAVGHISGDWGGGGHLWQEAMWWAARAEDGRGPETSLRTALPRHLGLDSMGDLIEAVHLGTLPEERCLELTPVLFAVAEAGDQVAADVVRRQAHEVVALAATAIQRLGVTDLPIDVVLGGGVLTAGHRGLMDEIEQRLAEEAPHARVRVVQAPPIVGAALLGLDRIGATPAARQRLREAWGNTKVRVVG